MQDDLEVDILRLPSVWKDDENERQCFLRLSRSSTELLRCLRSFWLCRLRCERHALDFSSSIVHWKLMRNDLVVTKSCLSLMVFDWALARPRWSSFAFLAAGAIKPGCYNIISIRACIKRSDCVQRFNHSSSVSCRTPRRLIFLTTLSKNEKQQLLVPSETTLYFVVKTSQTVYLTRFLNMLFISSRWVLTTADFFYLDQWPWLLPSFPDNGGVYPRGGGSDPLSAATRLAIIMGHVNQKVGSSIFVCCAWSSVFVRAGRSRTMIYCRLKRRAVGTKCSIG